ncbi:MAG: general secretion pathway protein GspK [Deltaproteobacteria bacterium]|nr:general secretion pathway protein GspK [Deltaproteobacteria bacterium]
MNEQQKSAQRARRKKDQQRGLALLTVVILIAVMTVMASDFSYNARVDFASAANARDELQAHYLARSSINLSRLLLKVQEKLIDPNRRFLGGMDIQIADYAPWIVQAFNGPSGDGKKAKKAREDRAEVQEEEEAGGAAMIGAMLGIDASRIKGLGVDRGQFDLSMQSLDGRLNLNCGGGANTTSPVVVQFAAALAALLSPERYNPIFEDQDDQGQYADRMEVLRAIIDWADRDTVMFGSTAAEDYRYNTGADPYKSKDQYFDTLEELRLVRGVDERFIAAFEQSLTVYGSCTVNVATASPALLAGLITQHAATPNDPGLQWKNLALLTRYVVAIRGMSGGFSDAKAFIKAVEDPMSQLGMAAAVDNLASGGQSEQPRGLPPVTGVKLNPKVSSSIVAGGPRRIWKIVATAEVNKTRKRIVGVWDAKHITMQAGRHNFGPGAFLYWREE